MFACSISSTSLQLFGSSRQHGQARDLAALCQKPAGSGANYGFRVPDEEPEDEEKKKV